jgi:hypothetical protein
MGDRETRNAGILLVALSTYLSRPPATLKRVPTVRAMSKVGVAHWIGYRKLLERGVFLPQHCYQGIMR